MTLSELGISRETHWRWTKIYPEYAEKIERARAKAEKKMLGLIKDAAPKDWRAALALLQTSIRPGCYGRVQPDQYDLPSGEFATLSISEHAKRMRRIFGVDRTLTPETLETPELPTATARARQRAKRRKTTA